MCCSSGRARRSAAGPRLDGRGLRRRRGGRRARGRSAPALEPVLAPPRRAATCRCSPTCAPTASTPRSPAARTPTARTSTPRSCCPLFVTNALDGRAAPGLRRRQAGSRLAPRRGPLRRHRLVLREGAPGEVYNIGGEEDENLEVTHRVLEHTGADASLVRHVEDRAGPRPPLRARRPRSCAALGWAPRALRSARAGLTASWYAANRAWWEPIKSGRVPQLLREAIRRAAPGLAARGRDKSCAVRRIARAPRWGSRVQQPRPPPKPPTLLSSSSPAVDGVTGSG